MSEFKQLNTNQLSLCFDNLESTNPSQRIRGLDKLLKIDEKIAFNAAIGLTDDPDEEVASVAKKIISCCKEKYSLLNEKLESLPEPQTYHLSTPYDMFDEVMFIIRNNLSGVVTGTLVAGMFKILLAGILLISPESLFFFHRHTSLNFLFFIVLFCIHNIFWRPFIWLTISHYFLNGFYERKMRLLLRDKNPWHLCQDLFFCNLKSNVFIYIFLLIAFLLELHISLIVILGIIVLVATEYLMGMEMPTIILKPSNLDNINYRLRLRCFRFLKESFVSYVLIFFIIAPSSYVSMLFLGIISTQPDRFILVFFTLLLIAQVFADTFLIGSRLLTARMALKEPKNDEEL